MTGRCKDCRHWGAGGWDGEEMFEERWRECGLAEVRSEKWDLVRNPLALFRGHGGDMASYVFTAPDFGCVQFEPKEGA